MAAGSYEGKLQTIESELKGTEESLAKSAKNIRVLLDEMKNEATEIDKLAIRASQRHKQLSAKSKELKEHEDAINSFATATN